MNNQCDRFYFKDKQVDIDNIMLWLATDFLAVYEPFASCGPLLDLYMILKWQLVCNLV